MPEFEYKERPVYSPTSCALCGNSDVPVIDTKVERDVIGRIYICSTPPGSTNRGCAEQMAYLLGWAHPEEHRSLLDEFADLSEQNEQLATELSNMDQPLVVYEGDLRAIVAEFLEPIDRGEQPKPKGKPKKDPEV